jgi:ABC-type nitrate/sulfonate/bicarbonate transport system substrate-binding protein
MGYDIQVLGAVEKGLPIVTVGTSFQYDLQGLMTHSDIGGIADLKGHTILIASSSHVTFWPWLRQRFGFTDDMAGVYTLQPATIPARQIPRGAGLRDVRAVRGAQAGSGGEILPVRG